MFDWWENAGVVGEHNSDTCTEMICRECHREFVAETTVWFAEQDADKELAHLEAVESIDAIDIEDMAQEPDPHAAMSALIATRSERSMRASIAAHAMHAQGKTNTEPARRAMHARFEKQVDPDGTLDPRERAKRAEHAKSAYYKALALKSAQVRRRKKADKERERAARRLGGTP